MKMSGEPNINQREVDTNTYLQRHRILDLFNNMTSLLIYNKPEEPREFLIEQLEKLKVAQQSGMYYPCLFDESNLHAIFGMLDPTKRGFISKDQYCEALKTIGVKDFELLPTGAEIDKITIDTFLREAKKGLAKYSATFKV
uniref:EF-hand calcium-binding domain-containing protein 10-like n=1 Tax=Styela clava TaxID=7725 RepID=UPI001939A8A3|nr:EF-hand calcium-binding domain-containing protein 10-like [Styela clava]